MLNRRTPCEWKEPKGRRTFDTIGERLYWSYANLAMAHAAVKSGDQKYGPFPHFQIRARLYKGLNDGTMQIGTMFEDERLKLLGERLCVYCGDPSADTADHLIPRIRGGSDAGENLVLACRSCNSSKGAMDVMAWHKAMQQFPTLEIVRRYLKIAILQTKTMGLMAALVDSLDSQKLPFDISAVPMVYPAPTMLRWQIDASPASRSED